MNAPRCRRLDARRCRCMRTVHQGDVHAHDFSYTPWPGEIEVSRAGHELAVDGQNIVSGHSRTEERWGPL